MPRPIARIKEYFSPNARWHRKQNNKVRWLIDRQDILMHIKPASGIPMPADEVALLTAYRAASPAKKEAAKVNLENGKMDME